MGRTGHLLPWFGRGNPRHKQTYLGTGVEKVRQAPWWVCGTAYGNASSVFWKSASHIPPRCLRVQSRTMLRENLRFPGPLCVYSSITNESLLFYRLLCRKMASWTSRLPETSLIIIYISLNCRSPLGTIPALESGAWEQGGGGEGGEGRMTPPRSLVLINSDCCLLHHIIYQFVQHAFSFSKGINGTIPDAH